MLPHLQTIYWTTILLDHFRSQYPNVQNWKGLMWVITISTFKFVLWAICQSNSRTAPNTWYKLYLWKRPVIFSTYSVEPASKTINLRGQFLKISSMACTIPKELFRLSALSISLDLSRNHLVGSLPLEIGNLKNVMELDLSENDLLVW